MTATPYATAAEVLADRTRWCCAVLGRLIQQGRREGWIDGAPTEPPALDAIAAELGARLAVTPLDPEVRLVEWMAMRLELGAREVAVLWLLACIEIGPGAARLAQAFGACDGGVLSLAIVRALVPLTDGELAHLETLGLLEVTGGARVPQSRRGVRAADRVIALAQGELALDRELGECAAVHALAAAGACPDELRGVLGAQPAPVIVATGPDGAGRATVLAACAATAGLGTLRVRAPVLAREPAQVRRLVRAVLREAAVLRLVPLFEDVAVASDDVVVLALEDALVGFGRPVLVTSAAPVALRARPVVVHRVAKPDRELRAAQWAAHVPTAPTALVREVADQYALWPGAIAAAARNAVAVAAPGAALTATDVQAGVRAYLGEQLQGLATRIDWRQTWDDVVLPPDQFEQLIELVARVRHRGHVLERWGFGDKTAKGHGIAALLSGPPGTGKTMVAGLIAQELGLDLYQVDLSKVVSKYIGETEKQLGALFDAAETGQAIILFDEADALFAKRSEVKSSNDRYANLEVNYLLQRLEQFTGVCLLTTNHETAIDEAFRRRLALHVRFPLPDEPQRAELWRALMPRAAEVSGDIDPARLAEAFVMSGGYIKNAVLRAAYRAADEGTPIAMRHLWRAARAEYESMGKVAYEAV